jgi:hypothetical protein
MTEPIIRTMYVTDTALARMRDGMEFCMWANPIGVHPVLIIHAENMPDFRAGDRVRNEQGEEMGVDGVYLDESGIWCFVGYDADTRVASGWSRVEPASGIEEPAPRVALAIRLSEFKVGAVTPSAMADFLDDYIRRALGRAER